MSMFRVLGIYNYITLPQVTMVVNSVEGVQSNGKWHNNEIYIDCYQYFDDHDHTTNTTPYMAVNSR